MYSGPEISSIGTDVDHHVPKVRCIGCLRYALLAKMTTVHGKFASFLLASAGCSIVLLYEAVYPPSSP